MKLMGIKSTIIKGLLLSVTVLLMSASPVNREAPVELTALIQKKWPGSKIVLVPKKPCIENETSLYKITQNTDTLAWAFIRRVNSCRTGGCNQLQASLPADDSHEYFEYFAILDKKLSILEIKVYNYAATHGVEICSKAWLKQFKGYNGAKVLRYGKDIDAISGATISGIAITEDITNTVRNLKK